MVQVEFSPVNCPPSPPYPRKPLIFFCIRTTTSGRCSLVCLKKLHRLMARARNDAQSFSCKRVPVLTRSRKKCRQIVRKQNWTIRGHGNANAYNKLGGQCMKRGIRTVPKRTFSRRTFLRRTFSRRHFPDGHVLDEQFPEEQFPELTTLLKDISPTESSPNGSSPNGHFPESRISFQE